MAFSRRSPDQQGQAGGGQDRADPHLRPDLAGAGDLEARGFRTARAAGSERRPRGAEGGRAAGRGRRAARPGARAAAEVLAVLEFRDEVPADQRINTAYLADQARATAKEMLPQLKVITRENMLVLLQASGKKLEECEGECEVDTGRRIGADLVVSGELIKFGTQYKLNMKLHDTRSGELLSGAVASGATADNLDRNLGAAVSNLLEPLRSVQQPRAAAEE